MSGRDARDLRKIVRNPEDGGAASRTISSDERFDPFGIDFVDDGGRFIQQKGLRPVGQYSEQRETLAFAIRQPAHGPAHNLRIQIELGQPCIDARREVRSDRVSPPLAFFRQQCDLTAPARGLDATGVRFIQVDAAIVRIEVGHGAQQGRLSGARRAR